MKCLFIFILPLVCFSCDLRTPQQVQIDKMESLLALHPDSVYFILDSLINEYDLDDAYFAKSCLLVSKSADKIGQNIRCVDDYKKALMWFNNNGAIIDKAFIQLYLGRSYVGEMDYKEAMNSYLYALNLFEQNQDFNNAAYVVSYIGDLFEIQNDPVNAQRNYELAADYFHKSGNRRSYSLALNDLSRQLAFQDSCKLALKYLKRADSLANNLQDSVVQITVYNSLGNVYKIMKRYSDAEKYLLHAASIDAAIWGVPNLLALSDLYLEAGDLVKAVDFQNQVITKFSDNKEYLDMILYNQYEIYKAQGNYKDALSYLEKYQEVVDSHAQISDNVNLLEMEKKYNKLKIQQENQQLKLTQQLHIILLIVTISILLVVLLIYLLLRKKQMRKYTIKRRKSIDLIWMC